MKLITRMTANEMAAILHAAMQAKYPNDTIIVIQVDSYARTFVTITYDEVNDLEPAKIAVDGDFIHSLP